MSDSKTILLCGVGGQGIITAADLLARVADACGLEVKVSEIHGMAQRGGAVTTVVRIGTTVNSMMADKGATDCIVSFETTEALRNVSFLKKDGYLLVADETIKPLPVASGKAQMPKRARERLIDLGATLIPADTLAKEAGNIKCKNVVLLGALEARLNFTSQVWKDVIAKRVPQKTIEANRRAFDAGYRFAKENLC